MAGAVDGLRDVDGGSEVVGHGLGIECVEGVEIAHFPNTPIFDCDLVGAEGGDDHELPNDDDANEAELEHHVFAELEVLPNAPNSDGVAVGAALNTDGDTDGNSDCFEPVELHLDIAAVAVYDFDDDGHDEFWHHIDICHFRICVHIDFDVDVGRKD